MSIEKGLIGFEDINFGTDTFQRKSQSGQFIPITKIRASHIPVLDSAGRFTGSEVETALAECMTREESGSNVKKLTNRSGSQRVAGDVVVIDTNNDDSFTLTSTTADPSVIGVVLETIEDGFSGLVATGGYIATIKVSGSTVRGQFLRTSLTSTKASPTSFSYYPGIFAIAVSNGSSTVSAVITGLRTPYPFFSASPKALANDNTVSGTLVTTTSRDFILGDIILISAQYYAEYNGGNATDVYIELTKSGAALFSYNGSSQQKPLCGGTMFDLTGAGQYRSGTMSAILLCAGAGGAQFSLNTAFTGTSPRWVAERTSMETVLLPYLID